MGESTTMYSPVEVIDPMLKVIWIACYPLFIGCDPYQELGQVHRVRSIAIDVFEQTVSALTVHSLRKQWCLRLRSTKVGRLATAFDDQALVRRDGCNLTSESKVVVAWEPHNDSGTYLLHNCSKRYCNRPDHSMGVDN